MDVACPHCGQTCTVPPALRGGILNCPSCGRAVEAPGRSEGMYWALVGLGAAGGLAAAGVAFVLAGPAAGITVLGIGVLAAIAIALVAP